MAKTTKNGLVTAKLMFFLDLQTAEMLQRQCNDIGPKRKLTVYTTRI